MRCWLSGHLDVTVCVCCMCGLSTVPCFQTAKVQALKNEQVRRLSVSMAGDELAEPHPVPLTIHEVGHVSSSTTEVTKPPLPLIPGSASVDSKFSMMKFAMDHFRQGEARHVTRLHCRAQACVHYTPARKYTLRSLFQWVAGRPCSLCMCGSGNTLHPCCVLVGVRLSTS